MHRGRKTGLVAGLAATTILLVYLGVSDELRIQYHLYRLRSGSAESLKNLMGRPAGSVEREAVDRFVATDPGRQQLLSLIMDALAETWDRPRSPGGRKPLFGELGHALCGMRFRSSKNEWSLWIDIRAPTGMHWGTAAIVRPSFTSGESLRDVLSTMCREVEPGAAILLPGYPGRRFRVFAFEDGYNRYTASLRTLGHPLEETAFWFEVLRLWPEMLRSESLLPWVICVDSIDG